MQIGRRRPYRSHTAVLGPKGELTMQVAAVLLSVLAIWTAASLPVALAVGHGIHHLSGGRDDAHRLDRGEGDARSSPASEMGDASS